MSRFTIHSLMHPLRDDCYAGRKMVSPNQGNVYCDSLSMQLWYDISYAYSVYYNTMVVGGFFEESRYNIDVYYVLV